MGLLEYTLLALATASGLAAATGGVMMTVAPPNYQAVKAAFWFSALCFGGLGVLWGSLTPNQPLVMRLLIAGSTAAIAAMALTYILSIIVPPEETHISQSSRIVVTRYILAPTVQADPHSDLGWQIYIMNRK